MSRSTTTTATTTDPGDLEEEVAAAPTGHNIYGTPAATATATTTDNNKWSKNGYGIGVARQRTGQFSKEESDQVRKAVEDFCVIKQISVARLCSECDHKAELKGAWMEIAKRLPHRSVQSVYRHGLRQLHPFKRGAWSDDEVESLVDLVPRLGKKWSLISRKLNRSADSCRDKYREMSDEYIRGRWKEPETALLQKLIRDHLQADPSTDIKGLARMAKMAEAEGIRIPWSLISKRMEKRSRLSCFKKWQKMTNLVSDHSSISNQNHNKDSSEDESNQMVETHTIKEATVNKTHHHHHQPSKPRRSTHSAPTAGAAAALAAGMADDDGGDDDTYDQFLLTEIANSGVIRASQIDWDAFRWENAESRWNQLLSEFEEDHGAGDEDYTVAELAQAILDRKASAQRAAETVEAVDLPAPESLHREV